MEQNKIGIELRISYESIASSFEGFDLPKNVYEAAIIRSYNSFIEQKHIGESGIPIYIIIDNEYKFLGYASITLDVSEITLDLNEEYSKLFENIDEFTVVTSGHNMDFSYLPSTGRKTINYIDFDIITVIPEDINPEYKKPENKDLGFTEYVTESIEA